MSKTRTILVLLGFLVTGLALSTSPASAQLRRPTAELTPVVQQQTIQPGLAMTGELRIELPEGIHVQSNEPRDPYLIPTRLTFALPEGVMVEELTYPPAADWFLDGQEEPLAVFETEFTIEWRMALAADVSPGVMLVPGRFQYQSCDDRLCYPPVTADVEWRVQVDPAGNR
jgi:DsbC/DsbD-like thiol-disulfide interchange protein